MLLLGRLLRSAGGARRERLLPAAVVLVGLALPVVWIVLSRVLPPSDGTLHYFLSVPSAGGVSLTRSGAGGPLEPGDEVIAVNGRPLREWLRNGCTCRLHKGDRLVYTVLRRQDPGLRQNAVQVPITLGNYPVAAALRESGGAALLLLATLVVSVIVFLRRPFDSAARTLFAIPLLISVGATSWPFGPQVVDLITPYGYWSYVGSGVANAVAWGAFLHLALILPRPPPVVRRHPRLLAAGYVLPFLLYAMYLLIGLPGTNDPLDRLRITLHVSLPAARTYPVLIIVVVLAHLLSERRRRPPRPVWWELAVVAACVALYLLAGQLPQAFGRDPLPPAWLPLILLPAPVAVGAAILRHRLFDVELVIRHSLLYGSLTGVLLSLYTLATYLLGHIFGPTPAALVATALVALSVHPLRIRIRRLVGRRVFGQRHEPLAVASRLGRIDIAGTPQAVLGQLVRTLTEALRLSYAAIEVGLPGRSVEFRSSLGEPRYEPQRIPLAYADQRLGYLHLSVAAGREAFGASDQRLLDELARYVGVTSYALLLATELQHSRERLVSAREEERRRLRRDLHDGLGPSLAATAMQLEILRDLVRAAPTESEAIVDRLLDFTRQAITDVRRLVDGLRPPALDQLGLIAAIRERATYFARPGGAHAPALAVTVEATGDLDALPAAIEVAAFHITMEAVNNAARHASAGSCRVQLTADRALWITVADDGRGLPTDLREGVGLSSMRERAAEVGGTCTIERRPGGGTIVRAELPIAPTTSAAEDRARPTRREAGQPPHDDGTPATGH